MDWLQELIEKNQNYAGVVMAGFAAIVAGFFRYLARRPVVKQAVSNSQFHAQLDGFKALSAESDSIISRQRGHIAYLEAQLTARDAQIEIKDDYETELLKQLTDARRQLVKAGLFHDPSC